MAFVVTQRVTGLDRWARTGVAACRRGYWQASVHARTALTPQERANLYVSRMPIAVVTASLGGHPSTGNRR